MTDPGRPHRARPGLPAAMDLFRAILPWLAPVAMAAMVLYHVAQLAPDVPFWDSWTLTELAAGEQPLTPQFLWAQHNEHRIPIQKLFVYAWARLTGWSEYGATFFPAAFIVAGVCWFLRQLRREHPLPPLGEACLLLAISLLGLTLRQWENLFWSFQFSFGLLFLITIIFAGAVKAFAATGRGAWRLALLMTLAALSSAQGLALSVYWIGFAGVRAARDRRLCRPVLALAILAVGLIAGYLHDLAKPAHHPALGSFASHPGDAVRYCFLYLGGVGRDQPIDAAIFGTALTAVFILAFVDRVRAGGRRAVAEVYLDHPLLVIGVGVMLMVMIGRVGFGALQALSSRYVTFAILIHLGIWRYALRQLDARPALKRALPVLLVLVYAPLWMLGRDDALLEVGHRTERLAAYRSCVLRSGDDWSACSGEGVYPDKAPLLRWTRLLKERGLSFFREAKHGLER